MEGIGCLFMLFLLIIYGISRLFSKNKKASSPYPQQSLQTSEDSLKYQNAERVITITDLDNMSPYEFEHFVALLLRKRGYNVSTTQPTGDWGADVIGTDPYGRKVVVQVKKYNPRHFVGLSAVQQVYTAKDLFEADVAMIVTTSYLSYRAQGSAGQLKIQVIDRDILIQWLAETPVAYYEFYKT